MLISADFYDQLCPSYKKVIKELDDSLEKLQSDPAYNSLKLQKKIMEKFYANYLMPKEYWEFYERFDFLSSTFDDLNKRDYFYFSKNIGPLSQENLNMSLKLLELYHGQKDFFSDETDDLYPHSNLKERFQIYEMNLSCPPSKDVIAKYEKMKKFYQKIKASEGNVEQWFQNLAEVGNRDFLIHNVEYRLGGNLLDKKLWKLYIKFLETSDTKKMLKIYSKYCRFFLDDSEMKEEYKAKAEIYGPSIVQWDTVFDFEEKENHIKEEQNSEALSQELVIMDERDIPKSEPINKNILKNFYQNYQNQTFPFQKPFMEYILENANAEIWRKLYQTCKYFFAKKLAPICYKLQIQDFGSSFDKEALILDFSDKENRYLKNTWIATTLFCDFNQSIPQNYLSNIIPCFYKCDAKYITIWNQKLSYNEMKFLLGSGNVINLNLSCTRIKDEKDEWISLEKIMEFLPNVEELQLSNVRVNKNTANVLVNQKFNSKINCLMLLDIFGEPFDTTEFSNFCKKNRDENLFLRMEFKPRRSGFSNEFITDFRKLMEDANDLKKTHVEINFTPM